MNEHIGKVSLDYSLYPGEDFYSDGDIEDTLLSIVKEYHNYDDIANNSNSWPIFYHLSEKRANIISNYSFTGNENLLEIGAGPGAITGKLCDCVKSVTCVELSKKRSLINANRNKDKDNLNIVVANFLDFYEQNKKNKMKYDIITLIGVFEYAQSLFPSSQNPFNDMLNKINNLLSDNGKILIAIENRLGLKYFSGCSEDHTGRFFEGINGYYDDAPARTFSKYEWIEMLHLCGFFQYAFFYPYPDYKFPTAIYSDDFLPKKNDLNTNIRNFGGDRLFLFDETTVFNSLIDEGFFDRFSNSFLIEVERKI